MSVSPRENISSWTWLGSDLLHHGKFLFNNVYHSGTSNILAVAVPSKWLHKPVLLSADMFSQIKVRQQNSTLVEVLRQCRQLPSSVYSSSAEISRNFTSLLNQCTCLGFAKTNLFCALKIYNLWEYYLHTCSLSCMKALTSELTKFFTIKHLYRCKCELKAYVRKNKINSAKSLPQVGIKTGTLGLWDHLWSTVMPSWLSWLGKC